MLSTTKLQKPCDKNYSHYRALIQDPTGQSQELCYGSAVKILARSNG